jgi:hypothetical protein
VRVRRPRPAQRAIPCSNTQRGTRRPKQHRSGYVSAYGRAANQRATKIDSKTSQFTHLLISKSALSSIDTWALPEPHPGLWAAAWHGGGIVESFIGNVRRQLTGRRPIVLCHQATRLMVSHSRQRRSKQSPSAHDLRRRRARRGRRKQLSLARLGQSLLESQDGEALSVGTSWHRRMTQRTLTSRAFLGRR